MKIDLVVPVPTVKWSSLKGNSIDVTPEPIVRVLTFDEVCKEDSLEMAEIGRIFNHDVVQYDDNVLRWKPSNLVKWLHDHAPMRTPSRLEEYADEVAAPASEKNQFGRWTKAERPKPVRAGIDVLGLRNDFEAGVISLLDYMKYHMNIGYSLCGFGELFVKSAVQFQLDGAAEGETILTYIRRIHKWKVLRL